MGQVRTTNRAAWVVLAAAAAVAIVVLVAGLLIVLRTAGNPQPGADGPIRAGQPPQGTDLAAAQQVAAEVVERMHSFDAESAGPNAWLDDVHDHLTDDAYRYYRNMLGPGAGSTDSEIWQHMVATNGHQHVKAGNVRLDESSRSTSSEVHVTLTVPYSVESEGIDTGLADGDTVSYVNLDLVDGRWRVSAVMPAAALPPNYATYAATPPPVA